MNIDLHIKFLAMLDKSIRKTRTSETQNPYDIMYMLRLKVISRIYRFYRLNYDR